MSQGFNSFFERGSSMMSAKSLFVFGTFCLCGLPLVAQQTVRLVGSDLLGPALQPLLEETAVARGWNLQFAFEGSLSGEPAVKSGEADIAFLARASEEGELEGVQSWPFAFEVTTVVLNEANPIQELTLDQLRTLFAAPNGGDDDLKWGLVGGEGTWTARAVNLHAVRQRNHLNLELFRATVLGPREMRVNVRFWDSAEAMLEQIGEDPNSVGLYPLEEDHPHVRSLFLALNENTQAYNATEQSVFYGDYPLRLAFYAAVPPDASPAVAEVMRFLFSDEVAAYLIDQGYFPAPSTERQQTQMDLDFGS